MFIGDMRLVKRMVTLTTSECCSMAVPSLPRLSQKDLMRDTPTLGECLEQVLTTSYQLVAFFISHFYH